MIKAEALAIFIFAIVFMVIGLLRIIEFKGIGLKPSTCRVLISLHVLGCLTFAVSLIVGLMSLFQDERKIMFGLFILAMTLLAPGQFMIGIKRRQQLEP
jgi:hypothetical protein